MAHHGYLELEGGHLMVEFIVRQCSLPDDPPVSLAAVLHHGAAMWRQLCGKAKKKLTIRNRAFFGLDVN